MTRPLRERRDTDFAASVVRVETTTFVTTGDGERMVDRVVTEFGRGETLEADSVEWPHAAMFSFDELAFHVPETTRRLVRSYHPDGELARAAFLDGDGTQVAAMTVERDTHGRRAFIVHTIADAPLITVQYTYDDDVGVIESTVSMLGMLVSRSTRSVNALGLVEQKKEIDERGVTRTTGYRYTLNDRGDWVELTIHVDGDSVPATRVVRTIEYE